MIATETKRRMQDNERQECKATGCKNPRWRFSGYCKKCNWRHEQLGHPLAKKPNRKVLDSLFKKDFLPLVLKEWQDERIQKALADIQRVRVMISTQNYKRSFPDTCVYWAKNVKSNERVLARLATALFVMKYHNQDLVVYDELHFHVTMGRQAQIISPRMPTVSRTGRKYTAVSTSKWFLKLIGETLWNDTKKTLLWLIEESAVRRGIIKRMD